MRRLLVVVVIIVICIAGLGFYRGWFQISSEGSAHESEMTISVNSDKVRADEKKIEKSIGDIGHKTTGKASASEHHHDEP